MRIASFAERQVNVMWWCALGNAVCAIPIEAFFGSHSDWVRWGTYVALLAVSFAVSRRAAWAGVLMHLIGALGLAVWSMIDPISFAAHLGIGVLGFGIMMAPILVGLGVFLGAAGAGIGVVLGWASLIALAKLGGYDPGQVAFVAFEVVFVSLTGLGAHRLMASLEEARRALERASLIDDLTDLGNRRALSTEFERYVALASRRGVPLVITSWDVNDLKRINDSMGHAVGDAYLERFARALQSTARLEDAFFRVGGDEFIGLHLDLHDGEQVIERVRVAFPDVAAGWAHTTNGLEVALIEADRGMYADKAQLKAGIIDLFGHSATPTLSS
jgi:diguanylate cyclase (GGDEF)-like protein